MRIILDSNILLAALIKDSITRKIVMSKKWDYFYPLISIQELVKYSGLVIRKTGISLQTYNKLLNHLLSRITLVHTEKIQKHIEEAKNMISDPDDIVFVALQLTIPNSIIWSDDSDFDTVSNVLKTKDVVRIYQN
jgi:predicted nucleic acid-binding protein